MTVKPYGEKGSKKEQVKTMFNNIAPKYDFLNHILSMNIDKIWRRKTVNMVRKHGNTANVLDVACGTGDLTFTLASKLDSERIVGFDIAERMVEIAKKKAKKRGFDNIEWITGDSENMPFDDETFDAITAGFGVRNFEDLDKGISEFYRVLRHGGIACILEFSMPEFRPFRWLYKFYFRRILPVIGRIVSKDMSAYSYLPESVEAFPYGDAFAEVLRKHGFIEVKIKKLAFGIASVYCGVKG